MFKTQKLLSLVASFALFASANAFAQVSPSSVMVTVYGVALSTQTDCSNATLVGYSTAGTRYDFQKSPTLISGNVAPGTYQCVILYMNDAIAFTPATTQGSCSAGVAFTQNVGYPQTITAGSTTDGVNLTYTGNVSTVVSGDKALLFISTGSTGTGQNGNPFLQPNTTNGTNNGLHLSGAFTVSGTGASSGTFVMNFASSLGTQSGQCASVNPPTFGFR